MISVRRFMSSSTPSFAQRISTKKQIIISPWDRTVQAMMGNPSSSSSSTKNNNGYHHINNTNGSNGNNHHHHNSSNHSHNIHTRRSTIERIAIFSLVMMAWGWIMTFCGVLFYHGYQYRMTVGGSGMGDTITSHQQQKKQLPILPIQEETSKHQSESRKMIITTESNDNNFDASSTTKDKIPLVADTTTSKSSSSSSVEVVGVSPLLIFTCQRANYLQETLSYILQYIPNDCTIGCPIIISQDGHNNEVKQVIIDYQKKFQIEKKNIPLIHMEHKSNGHHVRVGAKAINPYEALAVHYGWALQQVFSGTATTTTSLTSSSKLSSVQKNNPLPQRIIILEEDLRIAPDFFDYFYAMVPILDHDTTLFAVSAFNDNGFTNTVNDPTRVLRSDFFPGLGWMMTRNLWVNELQIKWPAGYWDDWLREPSQRQNRYILRPEVSRTYHFGTSGGASSNQFGTQLSKVLLNDVKVDWTTATNNNKYSYLNQDEYDRQYWNMIEKAILLHDGTEVYNQVRDNHVRFEYHSMNEFQSIVRQLKVPLMDDEKAGIYRTAYKGIVETRPLGTDHFLFITPPMTDLREAFSNVAPLNDATVR